MSVFSMTSDRLIACRSLLRRFTGMAVAAGIVVASGVASATNVHADPLRIHYFPNVLINLPIWVAKEKGLFAAHGVDAQLFDIANGTVAMTALVGNSVDIMQMPPNYQIVHNFKYPQNKVVQLTSLFGAPIYSVLGRRAVASTCPDIKKPYPAPVNCMRGKKVGVVALGSDNYQVILSLLAQVGMTEKDVTIVPTGSTVGSVNMMRTDQIDYGIMAEPGAAMALGLGVVDEVLNISDDPLMGNWIGQASFAVKSAVDKDPAKFSAYPGAIADAVKFMQDPKNAAEIKKIFMKYVKVEPELADAMLGRHLASFNVKNDCEAIGNISTWLVKTGQIPAGNEPKCTDFVMGGAK